MADARKLKAMLDTMNPVPGGSADYGGAVLDLMHEAREEEHGGEGAVPDETSEEAIIVRKIGVGYMEIDADAGGFSCGTCRYVAPGPSEDEGSCMHIQVRAPVSATHGCCNLFWPDEGEVVFPVGALDPDGEPREPRGEPGEGGEGREGPEGGGDADDGGGGGPDEDDGGGNPY